MGTSKDEPVDDSETESYGAAAKKSDTEDEPDEHAALPPPRESCPYEEGEKVLAFHSLQVYEARVRKIEYRLNEWRYFLHYLGWNKNWDEWVLGSRLMKYTEENVQKHLTNSSKQDLEKNAGSGRPAQLKTVPRGRKRKIDAATKEKGALSSGKLVSIRLPAVLKKQLTDDCEFITHLGKLVKLPRVPNVDDITKKYLNYRMKKDGLVADSVREIMKGLQCYFDKVLPIMLLYKTERHQYEQAITDNVPPSMVYGAEHLLRLFVKLPELLLHANIEEETLTELRQKLTEFLKFLQKNQSTFFMSTYHSPEESESSKNRPAS
ncbi:hypothetical protein MLD38_034873 [Melastoma candidum]|uniref:Uncharacterized protein n=1 Tax=Melastoma candidum TaxID=119954 RepID=A0ACB9MBV5_9MYRT|nr:hypothetical protein MLD38_034873 [Melastoma candidum]